ncbi:MAG: hypothetical protein COB08_013405 [Rhodobacteraceae bacterium]|nr:hypothetical protein [Paracoccaceae bacterium]
MRVFLILAMAALAFPANAVVWTVDHIEFQRERNGAFGDGPEIVSIYSFGFTDFSSVFERVELIDCASGQYAGIEMLSDDYFQVRNKTLVIPSLEGETALDVEFTEIAGKNELWQSCVLGNMASIHVSGQFLKPGNLQDVGENTNFQVLDPANLPDIAATEFALICARFNYAYGGSN